MATRDHLQATKRFTLHEVPVFGDRKICVFDPQAGLIKYRATTPSRKRAGPGTTVGLQQVLLVAIMLVSLMAAMRHPI
jgi:hypothetical protein